MKHNKVRFSCSCLHVSAYVGFHINFSWVLPLDVQHLTQERWMVAGGQILMHHVRFISEKSLILQNQKMVELKGRVEGHLFIPLPLCSLLSDPNVILMLIMLTLLSLVVCHFLLCPSAANSVA